MNTLGISFFFTDQLDIILSPVKIGNLGLTDPFGSVLQRSLTLAVSAAIGREWLPLSHSPTVAFAPAVYAVVLYDGPDVSPNHPACGLYPSASRVHDQF
jgi:hypothetical protein